MYRKVLLCSRRPSLLARDSLLLGEERIESNFSMGASYRESDGEAGNGLSFQVGLTGALTGEPARPVDTLSADFGPDGYARNSDYPASLKSR